MHCAQGSIGNTSLNLNKYMGTYKYYSYFYREENSNLESTWLSQWGSDVIDGKMPTGPVGGCKVPLMTHDTKAYRDGIVASS